MSALSDRLKNNKQSTPDVEDLKSKLNPTQLEMAKRRYYDLTAIMRNSGMSVTVEYAEQTKIAIMTDLLAMEF